MNALTVCDMQIKNFHMSVGKIIPKFDGKSAKHMNVHSPAGGIIFRVIAKLGWGGRYFAETLE